MTKLFRSKSCDGAVQPHAHASAAFFQSSSFSGQQDGDNDEDDDEDVDCYHLSSISNPITTPFISPDRRRQHPPPESNNFTLLALLLAALRKSLVTCAVDDDSEDVSSATSSLDIGCPTDVRHVSHVTFDPFDGFLGLPLELQPDVPRKPPSASISVFGVSAESMQCSYDEQGNSVPTILLMMQKRLYSGGGLQAEGIFRINAENGQEEDVRRQLNRGFVPHGIDVHCLAGLIKAWFRELPTGVLDSLTPDQVMRCNTETECGDLVKTLPPTKAALLDWAVNLMADVVEHEKRNKMNARNIAMVFAPNMTQMADPLTALIHAVQVMNLLKTLVVKTLREREPPPAATFSCRKPEDPPAAAAATLNRLGSEREVERFWSFPRRSESVAAAAADYEYVSGKSSPASECGHRSKQEVEGILERLSLRKGVRRLCRHPVFQLSRLTKKNRGVTGGGAGEAWA